MRGLFRSFRSVPGEVEQTRREATEMFVPPRIDRGNGTNQTPMPRVRRRSGVRSRLFGNEPYAERSSFLPRTLRQNASCGLRPLKQAVRGVSNVDDCSDGS